jgi:uncharacterized protein YdaU (DUF1376 family)
MSLNHFPFYPGDYLRDTQRLSLAEHGAYMLLIMEYFVAGPLPDEDGRFARLLRVDIRTWRKLRPNIVDKFEPIKDGLWRHKRIDLELDKARRFAELGREGGIKSTMARQAKRQAKTQASGQPKTQAEIQAKPQAPQPQPLSILRIDKDNGLVDSTRMPRASPRPLERRASAQAKLKAEKARGPPRQGNGAANANDPPAEAVPLTEAECRERAETLRALAADIAKGNAPLPPGKGNASATGPPPDGPDEAKLAAWRDKPVEFSPAAKEIFGARVPKEPGG